ncbi:hypothetical protein JIO05_08420 [Pediococcus acidilactici]|uniref:hypothetical protein n=1 Tax=Pediococcus acidilactici TaxID=1254 RepID=UPI0006B6021A|nr:hypothetical protein [Pediococcus acidilactici]KAF0370617.1 hypothetical protein GBO58_08845 [Pediococcus acidilactici]KAF0382159.1 hypothetical protein GBO62_08760 [Pediococcus acidilactici]KAF0455683.1 hypothetical protein GBP02_08790 [Pediococcus acidilactici]KAF0475463.1 hypothetical protein GBP10_09055 [Pediococcus acidilactici]KAF0535332.1 hypothetical protein GBP37_09065 [Pediococcus acidilactici]
MKVEPNIVISEFITKMEDVLYHKDNSNVDILSKVAQQADSLKHFQVPYYVLTNEPSQKRIDNLNITNVDLKKIYQNYPDMTLYFCRIFMAFYFLQAHPEIEKAALTDATDVTMLNYPFDKVKPNVLYMGDETNFLFVNDLVIDRDDPEYMTNFFLENGNLLPTLNLGIIVGTRATLIEYLGTMVKLLTEAKLKFKQGNAAYHLGQYEMGISNYVAYKYFSDRLVHGREVSTVFSGFQTHSSAWFKHK